MDELVPSTSRRECRNSSHLTTSNFGSVFKMDIGLLLTLNFLMVPFIYEAEVLGTELSKFPNIADILKLKNSLKTRWIKYYGIFITLFIIFSFAPTASGKSYQAGFWLIISIILIQIVLWLFVVHKIQNSKN